LYTIFIILVLINSEQLLVSHYGRAAIIFYRGMFISSSCLPGLYAPGLSSDHHRK